MLTVFGLDPLLYFLLHMALYFFTKVMNMNRSTWVARRTMIENGGSAHCHGSLIYLLCTENRK